MRYALDGNGDKIEVNSSGQRASCPGCKKEVTGKIYKSKKNHWAHLKRDCDNWYEPISDWHIEWQNYFPKKNREITLFDEQNEEFHRADILLDNGIVIEIQNSPIVIAEVEQREKFYNKNGLIWILNAANSIPKSSFINYFKPNQCKIQIEFYKPDYFEFTAERFVKELKESYRHSFDSQSHRISTDKSIIYTLYSSRIVDAQSEKELLEFSIQSLNYKYNRDLYKCEDLVFQVKVDVIDEKYTFQKFLAKTQWRKFIDELKSPVFLHNVTNLHPDYLYWVQKEKLVEREKFITKYTQYT